MTTIKISIFVAVAALLITACGEELSGQVQKAASQVANEARQMAVQKVEEAKKQALNQILRAGKAADAPKEAQDKDKPGSQDKAK